MIAASEMKMNRAILLVIALGLWANVAIHPANAYPDWASGIVGALANISGQLSGISSKLDDIDRHTRDNHP